MSEESSTVHPKGSSTVQPKDASTTQSNESSTTKPKEPTREQAREIYESSKAPITKLPIEILSRIFMFYISYTHIPPAARIRKAVSRKMSNTGTPRILNPAGSGSSAIASTSTSTVKPSNASAASTRIVSSSEEGALYLRRTLLLVCRHWENIILSTPACFSRIDIPTNILGTFTILPSQSICLCKFNGRNEYLLGDFIRRSRSCPLDVTIKHQGVKFRADDEDQVVQQFVEPFYWDRARKWVGYWKEVGYTPIKHFQEIGFLPTFFQTILREECPTKFDHLTTLILERVEFSESVEFKKLKELVLYLNINTAENLSRIRAPVLASLTLDACNDPRPIEGYTSFVELLHSLFPALSALSIPAYFANLFKRARSTSYKFTTVKSLEITAHRYDGKSTWGSKWDIRDLLPFFPCLEDLLIWRGSALFGPIYENVPLAKCAPIKRLHAPIGLDPKVLNSVAFIVDPISIILGHPKSYYHPYRLKPTIQMVENELKDHAVFSTYNTSLESLHLHGLLLNEFEQFYLVDILIQHCIRTLAAPNVPSRKKVLPFEMHIRDCWMDGVTVGLKELEDGWVCCKEGCGPEGTKRLTKKARMLLYPDRLTCR